MKQILSIFFSIFSLGILCVACQSSADSYAERFCECSADLAQAQFKYKNGLTSAEALEAVVQAHAVCMGEDDPLKALEDSPEKKEQFKIDFIKALEKNCPSIAKDMGF